MVSVPDGPQYGYRPIWYQMVVSHLAPPPLYSARKNRLFSFLTKQELLVHPKSSKTFSWGTFAGTLGPSKEHVRQQARGYLKEWKCSLKCLKLSRKRDLEHVNTSRQPIIIKEVHCLRRGWRGWRVRAGGGGGGIVKRILYASASFCSFISKSLYKWVNVTDDVIRIKCEHMRWLSCYLCR